MNEMPLISVCHHDQCIHGMHDFYQCIILTDTKIYPNKLHAKPSNGKDRGRMTLYEENMATNIFLTKLKKLQGRT